MTLFEYLAVFVSIVLSFGVIRLLDGLPPAVTRGHRYWLHTTWLVTVLWLHVQYWWVLWSYNAGVAWNYPRFVLVLASPLLLYSLAITLVPRDPGAVGSWRDHFYRVRARFFSLYACWMLAAGLANWWVLGQPFLNRLRLGQGTFVVLFLIGATTRKPWYHGLLAVLIVLMAVVFITSLFLQPAPLTQ